MNVLRLVRSFRKSIHTALLGKIDDRKTRLLRNYVVRERNGSQRRNKWYVADRRNLPAVTLISAGYILLAKDGARFCHPNIHVSEISARSSVTWT